jgi:hypothetical protein
MTGTIPQSDALREVNPESITEFLSRSPTSLTPDDRKKMVGILREQRARWEKAEAAGEHTRPAKAAGKTAASLVTTKTAEDLGL